VWSWFIFFREHPGWHSPPAIEQFAIQTLIFRTVSRHGLPKAARMVHVHGMSQLMNKQIPHDRSALKEQAAIETDGTASGATAPSGSLTSDEHPPVLKTELTRTLIQGRAQHFGGAFREPAPQRLAHSATIPDIAAEGQ
jgi:hypothetical protein